MKCFSYAAVKIRDMISPPSHSVNALTRFSLGLKCIWHKTDCCHCELNRLLSRVPV